MARLHGEFLRRADLLVARYPSGGSRSALLPLLYVAQEQDGYVSDEAMGHIAELLGISAAEVLGTCSFYTMFKREPVGKYLISICNNISCQLLGADDLMHHAENSLGVPAGGTTSDGLITLEHAECLAACGGAPCLQVNYRYFENVTSETFDRLVGSIRKGTAPEIPVHGVMNRVREKQ